MTRSLPLSLSGGHQVEELAFDKGGGLVPAVVQHADSGEVLMVGFCDEAAVRSTLRTGLATFFSRSRGRPWVKGETSGNTLQVMGVRVDCDADTLLMLARPDGPTCHTGTDSCFDEARSVDAGERPGAWQTGAATGNESPAGFLARLDELVRDRAHDLPAGSYTTGLFEAGVPRIAQKVGEEGVETALAAVVEDDDALLGEAADLVYHLLVLLRSRGLGWDDVEATLAGRHPGTSGAH